MLRDPNAKSAFAAVMNMFRLVPLTKFGFDCEHLEPFDVDEYEKLLTSRPLSECQSGDDGKNLVERPQNAYLVTMVKTIGPR